MKRIKFNVSFFEAGAEKFTAGEHYPVDEESQRCVVRGIAEEIEVADPEPAAPAAATAEAPAAEAQAPAAAPAAEAAAPAPAPVAAKKK